VLEAFFAEIGQARGGHPELDRHALALATDLSNRQGKDALEYAARNLVDRMALALQASLLIRHAPAFVADAFCRSRLGADSQHNIGALPGGADVQAIIARATPQVGDMAAIPA
jgi:putative acyl-CoA dehydrogenase